MFTDYVVAFWEHVHFLFQRHYPLDNSFPMALRGESREMTCGFLIQLVFCQKKKLWFIGVEVKQETSAPPPKKKSWIRPWPSLSRKKNRKNSLRSRSWKVKGIGRKGNREGPWPFPPISLSPPPPPLPFLRLPHRLRKKWIGCLLGQKKKSCIIIHVLRYC